MIDKRRAGFLNFKRFEDRGLRRSAWRCVVLIAGVSAGGALDCSPQSAPGPAEDSLTSGRITVVAAPEAYDVVARERVAFQSLYPEASIELRRGVSREAVGALFSAECDLAVITRELKPEERKAASSGGLELEGYRFARDAVVAVVHPSNPLENLGLDDLRRIYDGRVARWSELGGRNAAIVPLVPPEESDLMEFVKQSVMGGEPVRARVAEESGDSAVVARVAREPNAIGFASVAWASRAPVKALRLASLAGLPYRNADLESIYKGEYPLGREFSLYIRSAGKKLPNGFITFVTSRDGQELVHEAGLVPTSVPVRFVRSSPMLGTH